jgi:hypothetical protein
VRKRQVQLLAKTSVPSKSIPLMPSMERSDTPDSWFSCPLLLMCVEILEEMWQHVWTYINFDTETRNLSPKSSAYRESWSRSHFVD